MKKRLLALLLLAAATCTTIAGAAAPQDLPAEPALVGAAKVGMIDNLNTGETIWEADSSTGTPQDSPAGPSVVLERTEPIESNTDGIQNT